VNRQIAAEFGLPFLDTLMDKPPFTAADTYDNCHFTNAGAEKMARVVFNFLKSRHLL
jgi:hypothetical protein